jgi:hypothetical protein
MTQWMSQRSPTFQGEYAVSDPGLWDPHASQRPLSVLLRHAGNQFCFEGSFQGKWARAQILWNELPKSAPVLAKHSFALIRRSISASQEVVY